MAAEIEARGALLDVLAPGRIAIVGASRNPRSLAGRYLDHLQRHGFPGEIVPINRTADEVRGIPAVPSLQEVEGPVDCALITVPGDAAFDAAVAAAEMQVPLVVMFSSGFAETGEAGRARQAELTAAFRASSSRLLGPNCPGFVNAHGHIGAAISAFVGGHELTPGGVSIVAQSGAVGGLIAERVLDRGAGLSHVVFTGNEADIELGEAVEAVAAAEECRVVTCFMEGFLDPERTLGGIAHATGAGTPVLVLSVGRSDIGQRAASLHTGKLVAVGQAERAALRQAGAILVDDLAEMAETAAALATGPRRTGGRRVGIVSTTGGLGAILADQVREAGFELPPTTSEVQSTLGALIPSYASAQNPCDLADALTTTDELLQRAVGAFAGSGEYDAILMTMAVHPDWLARRLAQDMVEASAAIDLPLAVLWPGGVMGDEGVAHARAGGVPMLESARVAGAVLAGWEVRAPREDVELEPLPRAVGLGERELKAALAQGGVEMPRSSVVTSAELAARAQADLGGVVVMKAHEPPLDHKAGYGLVRRGIAGADAARATFQDFEAAAQAAGVRVDSVLVEAQEHALGLELLVSCRRTALGLEVLVGPGGSTAELHATRALRIGPIGADDVRAMAEEVGVPERVQDALAAGVAAVQRLALAYGEDLAVLEVNPLLLVGDRAIALDAKLRLQEETAHG